MNNPHPQVAARIQELIKIPESVQLAMEIIDILIACPNYKDHVCVVSSVIPELHGEIFVNETEAADAIIRTYKGKELIPPDTSCIKLESPVWERKFIEFFNSIPPLYYVGVSIDGISLTLPEDIDASEANEHIVPPDVIISSLCQTGIVNRYLGNN